LSFCPQLTQWSDTAVGLQNVHTAGQVRWTWWSSSRNLLP